MATTDAKKLVQSASGTNPEDRPDTRSPASDYMLPDVEVCRDLSRGTRHMRGKGTKYLPQHPSEDSDDYYIRLNRSVLFNAFERTVKGLTGMVFRRNPVVNDDVPDIIDEHLGDIDLRGSHIDVFAREVFNDAWEAGHAVIVVDAPRAEKPEDRELTIAEERAMGIRPYWVHVRKDDIFSWRVARVGGVEVVTQFVYREMAEEPDGEFGVSQVERYRVLKIGEGGAIVWQVWTIEQDQPVMQAEGTIANITQVPVAAVYTRKTGTLQSLPPLLDLAWLNVTHYQVQSDYWHNLHINSVPILALSGVDTDASISIGPNSALKLPDPQARATYVETSGAPLAAARDELQDLETRMARLGLSMLQHETRAAETAEAKRIDKSEQDSMLAAAARSLQDALENALWLHAQHMQLPDGGTIAVNDDFGDQTLDAAEVQVYANMVAQQQLSLETLWSIMEEGGKLPDGFDADVELDRLGSLGPAPVALKEEELDE